MLTKTEIKKQILHNLNEKYNVALFDVWEGRGSSMLKEIFEIISKNEKSIYIQLNDDNSLWIYEKLEEFPKIVSFNDKHSVAEFISFIDRNTKIVCFNINFLNENILHFLTQLRDLFGKRLVFLIKFRIKDYYTISSKYSFLKEKDFFYPSHKLEDIKQNPKYLKNYNPKIKVKIEDIIDYYLGNLKLLKHIFLNQLVKPNQQVFELLHNFLNEIPENLKSELFSWEIEKEKLLNDADFEILENLDLLKSKPTIITDFLKQVGQFSVDHKKNILYFEGINISANFTKIELELIFKLFENLNEYTSKDELAEVIWNRDNVNKFSDQAINKHLSNIRKKIEDKFFWTIENERNFGYKLRKLQ